MKKKVNLIRSETWLDDDFDSITEILQETIDDFIEKDERIINIQVVKKNDGTNRFWIYTE